MEKERLRLGEHYHKLVKSDPVKFKKLAGGGLKKVASKFDLKTNVGSLFDLFMEKKDKERFSQPTIRPETG